MRRPKSMVRRKVSVQSTYRFNMASRKYRPPSMDDSCGRLTKPRFGQLGIRAKNLGLTRVSNQLPG